MTDSEIISATKALKAWFISQDISTGDAGIMMISLIAHLLTDKTKDLRELQGAINDTNVLLTVEVAGYLRP